MEKRPEFTPHFLETATAIRERMLNNIPDDWRKEDGDFPYDMIRANPPEVIQLEMQQDRILQNAFPQYCEDEYLDLFLQARGLNRIPKTYSVRVLQINADAGVRIPKGYTLTSVVLDNEGNPIEFTANAETIVEDAALTVDVRVTCKLPGSIGNLATGSEFVLQPPLPGVRSIKDVGIIIAGAEQETADNAWSRYLEKVSNPDTGGNRNDYRRWVINDFSKTSGVAISKVIIEMCWDKTNGNDGNGTVRVICVGSDYKPLSADAVTMLQQYLDPKPYQGYGYGKAPGGAKVTAITGATKSINVSAKVSYSVHADPATVLTSFKKSFESYIQSKVFEVDPATEKLYPIAYNKIGAILGNTEGVENYGNLLVNDSTADVVLNYFDIPTVGVVVLT
ncbi:MAG: baseplate J/gp47 family protein [Hydrogenoanaerobacterium sp.]